jgi:hypothetical protein
VKFNVPKNDNTNGAVDSLLAIDIFVHYFAESELEVKISDAPDASVQVESAVLQMPGHLPVRPTVTWLARQ